MLIFKQRIADIIFHVRSVQLGLGLGENKGWIQNRQAAIL